VPLPATVPLFPLPNVVHFPGVPLPLHVFEERYRAMVRDAMEGSRLIGMVLLRAGWEDSYYEAPPVYSTGTAGEIVRADPLDDGRWNIVLRGLREFVIEDEVRQERPYRVARVRWVDSAEEPANRALVERIWELLGELYRLTGSRAALPAAPDGSTDLRLVINLVAQQAPLPAIERQVVLEAADGAPRARRLATVLQLQIEGHRGGGPGSHALQ